MFRSVLLRLPVHAGRALVIYLHTIHAHVALARFGIFCEHQREGDKSAAILRPAFENGKFQQVYVRALANYFLARAGLNGLGKK